MRDSSQSSRASLHLQGQSFRFTDRRSGFGLGLELTKTSVFVPHPWASKLVTNWFTSGVFSAMVVGPCGAWDVVKNKSHVNMLVFGVLNRIYHDSCTDDV